MVIHHGVLYPAATGFVAMPGEESQGEANASPPVYACLWRAGSSTAWRDTRREV